MIGIFEKGVCHSIPRIITIIVHLNTGLNYTLSIILAVLSSRSDSRSRQVRGSSPDFLSNKVFNIVHLRLGISPVSFYSLKRDLVIFPPAPKNHASQGNHDNEVDPQLARDRAYEHNCHERSLLG